MNAGEFKKGQFFKHQNTIWRVTRKEVVAVGTHSHTKVKVFARPLHGGGEKNFIFAHEDKIEDLDIIRKDGTVLSVSPNDVQIMDSMSFETLTATCEAEIKNELKEGDNIIFVELETGVEVLEKVSQK
jgi:translation elongation factor P/translation initiation factor 5A